MRQIVDVKSLFSNCTALTSAIAYVANAYRQEHIDIR